MEPDGRLNRQKRDLDEIDPPWRRSRPPPIVQKLLQEDSLIQQIEGRAEAMLDEGYSFCDVVQALPAEDLELLRRKAGIQRSLAEMLCHPELVPSASSSSSP